MSRTIPMKLFQHGQTLHKTMEGKIVAQDCKLTPLSFIYAMIFLLGENLLRNIYNYLGAMVAPLVSIVSNKSIITCLGS
jgi:hypothetical protein